MNNEKTSFRKGQTVKLNVKTCFTEMTHGGERAYPHTHWQNDDKGIVEGFRKPTTEEIEAWYSSSDSEGLNSVGETKFPPTAIRVPLYKCERFTVVRGRARQDFFWGATRKGYVIIEKDSGERCFLSRELLAHA